MFTRGDVHFFPRTNSTSCARREHRVDRFPFLRSAEIRLSFVRVPRLNPLRAVHAFPGEPLVRVAERNEVPATVLRRQRVFRKIVIPFSQNSELKSHEKPYGPFASRNKDVT
jgi:hypothetical protein